MTHIKSFFFALTVVATVSFWSLEAKTAEIGNNDFRISEMGPDGDINYFAQLPAVAYNDTDNEYFVVWAGSDDAGGLLANEIELYGQRINAATGAVLGDRVRLTQVGTDGTTTRSVVVGQGFRPSVAYNSTDNEYLVLWVADDDAAGLADNEFEIFGQRVDASTGQPVGTDDFQISSMGTNGNTAFYAYLQDVAYNSIDDEYLVVWVGHSPTTAVNVNNDLYGQRIAGATGALLGSNLALRAPDTVNEVPGHSLDVGFPAVAYNPAAGEYLVAFMGDVFVNDDSDIFAQRVDGVTGMPVGVEFRVSEMGTQATPGNPFSVNLPRVAYNGDADEYLVVWTGDDSVDEKIEVYGQRLTAATGAAVGTDDFQISFSGDPSDTDFGPNLFADVTYNPRNREYLVVWQGDVDEGGGLFDNEFEVFGQKLESSDATAIGDRIRVSDMQGTGNTNVDILGIASAYNATDQNYLVVWSGDDDVAPLVDDEFEIFGQLLSDPECGNGVVEGSEGCDDGNLTDGDGCSAACVDEPGGPGSSGASGGCSLMR